MRSLGLRWEDLKTMVNRPSPDDKNKTSLHLAAQKGFKRVVKKLLEDGEADSSMADEDGWRPLHFACSAGHTAVVEELLAHEANPELTDSRGRNILHIASTCGHIATFQHIVERYPKLLEQSTTRSGMTPLHLAVWWGNEQTVKVCLENKADVTVKDNGGWTALMMAVYDEGKGTMDTLIKHIEKIDSEESHHLDTCDNEGKSPLMVACERGWEQGVKALGKAGASFNLLDNRGRTALHYVVMSGHLDIIETVTTKMEYKFLLMADDNGRSAFDDFDFNQAADDQQQTHLDEIMNHFVKDVSPQHPQRELLEWAAKGPKRSKMFRTLVKRLTSSSLKITWVLWILIDNFSLTTETLESVQRAKELANKLLLPESKSKKLARAEHGDEKDKSKSDPDKLIFFDMQNYLSEFAVAETYRRSLYKPVKPREGVDEVLRGFNATITQFFDRRIDSSQHKTKWIKQWRPIEDVIYGKGPKRIAEDARNMTQVITKYLNGKNEEEEVKKERKEKKKKQKNQQKKEDEQPSGPFNVVRVKQLWVWTILDVDEVQEDDLPKDFLNHPAIQEQITEASSQPGFTARIATLIANYCVDAYERKRTSEQVDTSQHSDSSSSNSNIVREELSTRSILQLFSDIVNDNAREEKRLFSDCHNLTRPRKEGNNGKLEGILTQASQLACDIKDLRYELNMLRSIVNFQLTVQKEMPGNTKGSSSITGQYVSKDLEELENVAKRTQESVDTILTLAETEIANDQARQATRQGRTMMVFTVVTILFKAHRHNSSISTGTVSFTFCVPVASIALFSDAAAKQWNRIWSPMEQTVTKHWRDFQEKHEDEKELNESKKAEDEENKKQETRKKKKDRLKRTLAEANRELDEMNREEEGVLNNRPDISPV
ncbi:hypothetical protein HYE67_008047 [Fusarium culmorum]|uniref:Ankyrin repeat protein n=1 Tax=Fusarium culmorum TaxID=5516 RepID=A0A7S8HY15_FUSCU|nr:hypothetical protein HYE67_008047 [Fusarium culmorum]